MPNPHADAVLNGINQALALSDRKTLGMLMFDGFFKQYPETLQLYANTTLEDFAARKFKAISELILDSVRNPEYAIYQMVSEVLRHEYFNAKDAIYFYGMVEHCRNAIQHILADEWNVELNEIWDESVQATKSVVQQAVHKAPK